MSAGAMRCGNVVSVLSVVRQLWDAHERKIKAKDRLSRADTLIDVAFSQKIKAATAYNARCDYIDKSVVDGSEMPVESWHDILEGADAMLASLKEAEKDVNRAIDDRGEAGEYLRWAQEAEIRLYDKLLSMGKEIACDGDGGQSVVPESVSNYPQPDGVGSSFERLRASGVSKISGLGIGGIENIALEPGNWALRLAAAVSADLVEMANMKVAIEVMNGKDQDS